MEQNLPKLRLLRPAQSLPRLEQSLPSLRMPSPALLLHQQSRKTLKLKCQLQRSQKTQKRNLPRLLSPRTQRRKLQPSLRNQSPASLQSKPEDAKPQAPAPAKPEEPKAPAPAKSEEPKAPAPIAKPCPSPARFPGSQA